MKPSDTSGRWQASTRNEEYQAYITSPAWQIKRLAALELAGNRCQVCNDDRRLDVHHRTYERFGVEEMGDLTVLCRRCHDLYHGSKKPKKRKKPRQAPVGVEKKTSKRAWALQVQNERLHAQQQLNKRKQQAAREGIVSPSLRAGLIDRIESR